MEIFSPGSEALAQPAQRNAGAPSLDMSKARLHRALGSLSQWQLVSPGQAEPFCDSMISINIIHEYIFIYYICLHANSYRLVVLKHTSIL